MKKLILTLMLTLITLSGFSQMRHMPRHMVDFRQYEVIDSIPLEKTLIYSPFDYESDEVISLGDGEYLIDLPKKDNMIIRTNKDRTKAIVVYNSFCFGRHLEFNIKENEKRLILWYEDDHMFCGYVYEKNFKMCRYVESGKLNL